MQVVRRSMRRTLTLQFCLDRFLPGIRFRAGRIVNGESGIVADLRAGEPILPIFVVTRGPAAG